MMKSCLKKQPQQLQQHRPLQRRYSTSYCPPPCYSPPASPIVTTTTTTTTTTSTSTSTSNSWDRRKRKICFGRIEIREHAYILGDNPSVSDGAPVSISWKCHNKTVYEVEYYEAYHPSQDRRRSNSSSLKLGVTRRAEILLTAGYSMADLMERTLQVANQKSLRRDSIRNRKWDAIHATIEKTTRKIKKAARRSSLLSSSTNHSSGTEYNATKGTNGDSCGDYYPPSSPSSSVLFDDENRSPKSVQSPKVHQGSMKNHIDHRDIDLEPRIDWALSA